MRYAEFRDAIHRALRRSPSGLTWSRLREQLALPYDRPCPNWTRRLEREIGLTRGKRSGRELVWIVSAPKRRRLSIPPPAR